MMTVRKPQEEATRQMRVVSYILAEFAVVPLTSTILPLILLLLLLLLLLFQRHISPGLGPASPLLSERARQDQQEGIYLETDLQRQGEEGDRRVLFL